MAIKVQRVIEIMVITRTPSQLAVTVKLIFNSGMSATYERQFPSVEAADYYADGLRRGLALQARLIAASIVSVQKFKNDHVIRSLEPTDLIELIMRDFIELPNEHY